MYSGGCSDRCSYTLVKQACQSLANLVLSRGMTNQTPGVGRQASGGANAPRITCETIGQEGIACLGEGRGFARGCAPLVRHRGGGPLP